MRTACMLVILFLCVSAGTRTARAQNKDVEALKRQLQDKNKNKEKRMAALRALKRQKAAARDAVPELILLVKEKDKDISVAAVQALAAVGAEAKASAATLITALKQKELRLLAEAALIAIKPAPGDVPLLIAAMKEGASTEVTVIKVLGSMGSDAGEALPALIAAMRDFNSGASAQLALIEMDNESVPALQLLARSLEREDEAKGMAA